MSEATNSSDQITRGVGRVVRAIAATVIAVAFIGLVLFLAAFLTAAALAAVGVAILAGSAWWLWSKIRGPRKSGESDDPTLLVARRGPNGWTVEGSGRF
ncbi:MAG: hypothetical protein CMF74_02720 [Maricaulis sp.]|jgi:hypothetical protein|nr:hypothetical protein [Maricaulis sp.]HAQ35617.1 hypothetical protein [Alphaproteobacteria bacterium]